MSLFPQYGDTDVLIQSTSSLISIGTERMLVEFGKANMLSKARQQPEKVKMVLEKVKEEDFQIDRRQGNFKRHPCRISASAK